MSHRGATKLTWLGLCLSLLTLLISYWQILIKWVYDLWDDPNYSHGLLVPFISLYIAWNRRSKWDQRRVAPWAPGLFLVAMGALLYIVGGIAGELFTQRFSFLLTLWGCLLTSLGPNALRPFFFPLVYLIFSVPLPYILYDSIGFPLKLIASSSATWFLHLIGVPIYREGNLLYLPNMVLEVVDACSGIRSLMSILALSVVVAWFMHKDIWRRILTCLMAIPVVLFTNSLRIVITGILAVKLPKYAFGFFHSFEGELLFLVGVALLLGLSFIIKRKGGALTEDKKVDEIKGALIPAPHGSLGLLAQFIAPLVILSGFWVTNVANRVEPVSLKMPLAAFPKKIGQFVEVDEEEMPPRVLEVLGVDSYILRAYKDPNGYVLWLYIGYFEDQKEGAMIHSPKHCYPGSGWSPIRSDVVTVDVDALGTGEKQRIKINEYLLQKGESRQMVYYWYQSRGRVIANEYVDRFYMIFDSILRRRSDGALVRISGAVDPEGRQKVVLLEFIRELYPHLQEFLPE